MNIHKMIAFSIMMSIKWMNKRVHIELTYNMCCTYAGTLAMQVAIEIYISPWCSVFITADELGWRLYVDYLFGIILVILLLLD